MMNSVGDSGASGLATALMKELTAQQGVAVSVVKKSQDIERVQGEAALKLIDSASSVESSGRIDLYA